MTQSNAGFDTPGGPMPQSRPSLGALSSCVYQVAKLRRLSRNAGNAEADAQVDTPTEGGQ